MGIIVTTHRPPRSTALQTRKETFRHPERWPRSLSWGLIIAHIFSRWMASLYLYFMH